MAFLQAAPSPHGPARRVRLAGATGFILFGVLSGCGGSELGAEVSGAIALDGKGIGPGIVTFVGADGAGNPANGAIGVDGSYMLKTSNATGLKPGTYRVSVSIYDSPQSTPGDVNAPAAKLLIPEKYRDAATSGLSYEVKSGAQTIDIPLTSK